MFILPSSEAQDLYKVEDLVDFHIPNLILIVQIVSSSKANINGVIGMELVYKGIRDCFSKTLKESGLRGLYRGVGM